MCGREGGRHQRWSYPEFAVAASAATLFITNRFPLAEPGARLSDAPSRVALA
jgi:hypothetical protein